MRDLAEAWETAVGADRMGLVVVQGPTGTGKTAVVRGLYGQLAMGQAQPAYWPATLDGPDPQGARNRGRAGAGTDGGHGQALTSQGVAWRRARAKRIYPPEIAPAEGSRPEFFWWGLTARPGDFAVLGGDSQIKRHVQGIAEAVVCGDRLTRDRLSLALTTVSFMASLGLLGPTLSALTASADNLRTARELLRTVPELAQSKAGLLEAARRRTSGTVFSATTRQQAQAAAEEDARCLGLVASVLPFLVAVEDAQFLDPETIGLLRVLSRHSGSAGLIVLTVDTDQPAGVEACIPGGTLGGWLSAEDRAQRLTRIRLDPLSADEMTEIAVAELGTGLDAAMLARVVDHAAGVPGILYDLLEAPAVAQALHEGGQGPPIWPRSPCWAGCMPPWPPPRCRRGGRWLLRACTAG